MSEWDLARVCDVCEQVPVGTKYSKELVQDHGSTKVLDQSQADIFGWHNNSADIYASPESPVFTFANHTCSMRWMEEPFSVIQNVFAMRGIPGKTDTRFLYYASGASVVQDGYKGHFPQFRESIIQIPPLPEQKKIAEILSGFDRQITLLQTRINSLQRQKKAMLNLLYDAPFDSSDSLQDLCDEDICYGVLQYNEDGIAEVPVVQIKNLDAWDLGGMKRIPVSLDKKFARSRIQGGDLLISVKGSVGKIALVPEGFTGNISRDIARVRTNSSEITPDFLKYWFASDHGVETLARIEVGTTRAELSIGKLRTLQVAYPPIKTQNKICDIARSIDHALTAMNESLEKHGILKKGLSADLLSGRKRVSV